MNLILRLILRNELRCLLLVDQLLEMKAVWAWVRLNQEIDL